MRTRVGLGLFNHPFGVSARLHIDDDRNRPLLPDLLHLGIVHLGLGRGDDDDPAAGGRLLLVPLAAQEGANPVPVPTDNGVDNGEGAPSQQEAQVPAHVAHELHRPEDVDLLLLGDTLGSQVELQPGLAVLLGGEGELERLDVGELLKKRERRKVKVIKESICNLA